REVKKAWQRNHQRFSEALDAMPVYATCAHAFGDLGTNRLFNRLIEQVRLYDPAKRPWDFHDLPEGDSIRDPLIPKNRSRYLAKVAEAVRHHHQHIERQSEIARKLSAFDQSIAVLKQHDQ